MSDPGQLIKMANDIGHFFEAQPSREDAIAGMAQHVKSYWTRRMLEKLNAHLALGNGGLEDLPREALRRLREHSMVPTAPPGGDAG